MGNPAGDTTILEMIVSPVKDHETAVQLLDACNLWPKQPQATVQQTVTALRRALLQTALYTSKTIGDPTLCNVLLAIYRVFCAYKGELATGAFDSTAADLTADAAETIGQRLHETVLEFLTGDKDSTDADGSERPSLLRMIDESVARHCELLSGTVRAEATLTRERVDTARGEIMGKVISQATTSTPRLYSEALLGPALRVDRFAGRSREEQDAIARVEIQERQVLIDPDPTLVAVWANGTSTELVQRANLAVEAVLKEHPLPADDPLNGPDKIKVTSVSKLRNGGVLFNFGDRLSADWVKRNRAAFAASFDPAALVRDRGYQILVKNVPVEVDIQKPETLRAIENANGLPANSLLDANWLKPVLRRRKGQQNAHARVAVSSPVWANALITNRIAIDYSTLEVERLMPEPLRCANCQAYGHKAKTCSKARSCGTCADPTHETRLCISPDHDHMCTNCRGQEGVDARHAAWHRGCPVRQKELAKLQQRRPEDFTRLFLTSSNTDAVLPRSQQFVPIRCEQEPTLRKTNTQRGRPAGRSATPSARSVTKSPRPPTPSDTQRGRRASLSANSARVARSSRSRSTARQTVLPVDDDNDFSAHAD